MAVTSTVEPLSSTDPSVGLGSDAPARHSTEPARTLPVCRRLPAAESR